MSYICHCLHHSLSSNSSNQHSRLFQNIHSNCGPSNPFESQFVGWTKVKQRFDTLTDWENQWDLLDFYLLHLCNLIILSATDLTHQCSKVKLKQHANTHEVTKANTTISTGSLLISSHNVVEHTPDSEWSVLLKDLQ